MFFVLFISLDSLNHLNQACLTFSVSLHFSFLFRTTINAEYTINPVNNAGLNFEYDEVVRNKDDRRRMNAGDCECCREVCFARLIP